MGSCYSGDYIPKHRGTTTQVPQSNGQYGLLGDFLKTSFPNPNLALCFVTPSLFVLHPLYKMN